MKNLLILCFAMIILTAGSLAVFGQDATPVSHVTVPAEKDIALLRTDLRSEKKKLIALNVPLTDVEATRFWPVYDQYVAEMTKFNGQFYDLVRQYSENQKTWTEAQFASMLDSWSKVQIEQAKTRQKYVPLVEKVIPAGKAALFFQIDRRLALMIDLQLASEIPLVQP